MRLTDCLSLSKLTLRWKGRIPGLGGPILVSIACMSTCNRWRGQAVAVAAVGVFPRVVVLFLAQMQQQERFRGKGQATHAALQRRAEHRVKGLGAVLRLQGGLYPGPPRPSASTTT